MSLHQGERGALFERGGDVVENAASRARAQFQLAMSRFPTGDVYRLVFLYRCRPQPGRINCRWILPDTCTVVAIHKQVVRPTISIDEVGLDHVKPGSAERQVQVLSLRQVGSAVLARTEAHTPPCRQSQHTQKIGRVVRLIFVKSHARSVTTDTIATTHNRCGSDSCRPRPLVEAIREMKKLGAPHPACNPAVAPRCSGRLH